MLNNAAGYQILPIAAKHEDDVTLFVHVWPCVQPKVHGWVHIMHGMSEHGARYAETAQWLNELGFHVSADDHRGHGLTGQGQNHLGHMGDHNGWRKCLFDQTHIMQTIAQHWSQPLCVLGHSMGSFMATQWVQEQSRQMPQLKSLILSGSNYGAPWFFRIAAGLAAIERTRQGKEGRSAVLDKLSFGAFNRRIHPLRTPKDWLCTLPEVVDAYIADPMTGQLLSNQFWFDFLHGLADLSEPDAMVQIPNDLPIYIFAGGMDPVGKYGKGIADLQKALRLAGKKDVTVHIYAQGRHEMLNEVNKQQVRKDLQAWLYRFERVKTAV